MIRAVAIDQLDDRALQLRADDAEFGAGQSDGVLDHLARKRDRVGAVGRVAGHITSRRGRSAARAPGLSPTIRQVCMILARTSAGVTPPGSAPLEQCRWRKSPLFDDCPGTSPTARPTWRFVVAISAAASFAMGRVWIALWVTFFAIVGWLFIAGFAGFNH